MTDRTTFTVVLTPVADPLTAVGERHTRDPAYRLKLALKVLLRKFGLKCVKASEQAAHAAGAVGVDTAAPTSGIR